MHDKAFLSLPRRHKQAISVAADFVLLLLAFWSALALRFETFTPELAPYGWQMIAAPLLAIPIFIRLGLYRAVIRFMEDRVVFVVAGGVTSVGAVAGGRGRPDAYARAVARCAGDLLVAGDCLCGCDAISGAQLFPARRARRRIRASGLPSTVPVSAGTQLAYALRAGREYRPVALLRRQPGAAEDRGGRFAGVCAG